MLGCRCVSLCVRASWHAVDDPSPEVMLAAGGLSGRHVVSGPLCAVCPAGALSSAQLRILPERLHDLQAASQSTCGSVCLGS